jgi:hypothetical protein
LKIKKFRIKPRWPVVGKILKGLLGTKKLAPEVEESLPLDIQAVSAQLIPAAFYHTWAQGHVPARLDQLLADQGLDKAVAVTAVVATAGTTVEESISDLLLKGESNKSQVLSAIGEEAADLSFSFIHRLLQEEAKGDDCETTDPITIKDQELLAEILTLLDAGQEGISLDTAGHLSPRFTRVAAVAWWPVKKKRITASLKKRFA